MFVLFGALKSYSDMYGDAHVSWDLIVVENHSHEKNNNKKKTPDTIGR